MVRKLQKEWSDTAGQSEDVESSESYAVEQVETTACDGIHTAVAIPRHDLTKAEREVTNEPQPERADTNGTLRQQAVNDVHTRQDPAPAPIPQESGRRAFARQAEKAQEKNTVPEWNAIKDRLREISDPNHAQVDTAAQPAGKAPKRQPIPIRERPDTPAASTVQPKVRWEHIWERAIKKRGKERISIGRSILQSNHQNTGTPVAAAHPEVPTQLIRYPDASPKKPEGRAEHWTPNQAALPTERTSGLPIRERTPDVPAHSDLMSRPSTKKQMRQIFVEKKKQSVHNPSIASINPPEQAVSILPQPIAPEIPAATANHRTPASVPAEAQPLLQPAPPQAPSAKQVPAVRERTDINAAPRETPRSGVTIRMRETVPPGARKVQPAPSVSGIAARRAQKVATQAPQRKMLKKSNSSAARATTAASKRLVEAAAKAGKELIGALAGLGGGVALLVVFCVLIVAGALLASPLGILFADEQKNADTVPLTTAIAEIQGEYHAKLEELQSGDFVSIQIIGQAPDWREVVAVFASKTAGSEDGMDVLTLDAARVELLRQVFWDMCQISTQTEPTQNEAGETETVLTITISAKTAEQMRLEYAFSTYQNDALDILLENLGSLHIPMDSLTISQEDAIVLLENLPDDLGPARKAVVETALQLVGKVTYFWGGKSLVLGWDDRWGVPTEVTAEGSGSTGTVRPFGLDCSGFVDWVFYNATNGAYYPGHGGGAATQHSYCMDIPWSEAQAGDLVFYPDDSHVGIVGGTDADGNLLIIHCSSGADGVVITGTAGFTAVAKPECFAQ